MTEGLFWLICHMDDDAIDWTENWEIYHLFVRSDAIKMRGRNLRKTQTSVFAVSHIITIRADVS